MPTLDTYFVFWCVETKNCKLSKEILCRWRVFTSENSFLSDWKARKCDRNMKKLFLFTSYLKAWFSGEPTSCLSGCSLLDATMWSSWCLYILLVCVCVRVCKCFLCDSLSPLNNLCSISFICCLAGASSCICHDVCVL